MTLLTKSTIWHALEAHYDELHQLRIDTLFESNRAEQFSLEACGLYLDYAKNHITTQTLSLLTELAEERGLHDNIQALIRGDNLNQSEQRPACHMALRQSYSDKLMLDGQAIAPQIAHELEKLFAFADKIQQQQWKTHAGKAITDVVNIGIGGSHLGPKMVCRALSDYHTNDIKYHFIANIDQAEIDELLAKLDPDSCLFIVSSKSFTTLETLQNAKTIKNWLGEPRRAKQFVAVTAEPEKAIEFGISESNIFQIWDFVGGRYSLWSATGLPIILAIGRDNFCQLLGGAREMDRHFVESPLQQNMPVILGLLSVWYINFFRSNTQAILPYSHHLRDLPAHLQQLDMESCGKSVTQQGHLVDYQTGSIIWGEAGTIGQHSFHQLLHQGTYYMPIDFILPIHPESPLSPHQAILIASCLSQSQSLLMGTPSETQAHKIIPGNKPSNTIILNGLTPRTLGALIALYEHKVFVQASIWNINPFDQFGVELGKQLTGSILHALTDDQTEVTTDASTARNLVKIKSYLKNC